MKRRRFGLKIADVLPDRAGKWAELSEQRRLQYRGKLSGLFGHHGDEAAYDSLPRDKQEALALLADRLITLDLWQRIARIVNVYGKGGVGINFIADSGFENLLAGRKDFTWRFARRDNTGGFFEKWRTRASLHFLFKEDAKGERDWHVHFDVYGPMGSLVSVIQHLYYERFGKLRPDWRTIQNLIAVQK